MRPSLLAVLLLGVCAEVVSAGRDYYEVLGLEKSATDKDIKRVRSRVPPLFREPFARSFLELQREELTRAISATRRRTGSWRRRCIPTRTRMIRKPTRSLRRSGTVRSPVSSLLSAFAPSPSRSAPLRLPRRCSAAYEVLIDPDKRPKYDMHGEDGLKPDQQRGGGGFGDFFGFGGGRQQDGEKRKDDTPMDIEVTLQELYLGSSRTVRRPESLPSAPALCRAV